MIELLEEFPPESAQECLLIVFTDEVGSTSKDEEDYELVKTSVKSVNEYKNGLLSRRSDQFALIVRNLLPTGAVVVKNVGDALVITLKANQENDTDKLINCLKALFQAWKALKSTIRVAVHIACIREIVTGVDLHQFREQIITGALPVC